MTSIDSQPVMAEAADVLSGQLRRLLKRLAHALAPEAENLEQRYAQRLERLGYDAAQRAALASLTTVAAARMIEKGGTLAGFLEQVEYNGRRLAKLYLPPTAIVDALGEYDRLQTPVLRRLSPEDYHDFQWVREQLQFCVLLTLNNAFYQVREAETQAFYEMFWAELESRSLDQLLERLLAVLARFCRADAAHLYLSEPDSTLWTRRAIYARRPGEGGASGANGQIARPARRRHAPRSFAPKGRMAGLLLNPDWNGRFASCWSVPLISAGRLAGVMQFGFEKNYHWLPREQELLTAAADRCLLAAEKARLVEHLAQRERQIRELAGRMMQVEEAERRRISRELHDQAGQDLLCIRLQLEMLEADVPASHPDWKDRLVAVRDLTERTILEIRRLIAALSPAVLQQLGLAAALRQLVLRFRQSYACRVRLRVGKLGSVPKRLEVVMYRLVQECCNNIAKHSQCRHVNISADSADGVLRLIVEDDGVGFDVEEALKRLDSHGLSGIRERVTLHGGRFEIRSRPRGNGGPEPAKPEPAKPEPAKLGPAKPGPAKADKSGTRIVVEIPMEPGVAEAEARFAAVESRRTGIGGKRPRGT